jgi:large subunit ribosomal protein L10
MVPQSKIDQVESLSHKLTQAKAVVFTDYTGLNVEQMSALRRQIKAAGGKLEVAKNTLLKRAAETAKITLDFPALTQPTAVLWAKTDEIAPLKTLSEFIKINTLPKIKAGLFQKTFITADQVKQLANLPTQEVLYGQMMSLLQAPITQFTQVLNTNLLNLISVLRVTCCVLPSKGVINNGRK